MWKKWKLKWKTKFVTLLSQFAFNLKFHPDQIQASFYEVRCFQCLKL